MVILNQRRIITPKNIVLLGIILLSTYTYSSDTYSTEFKLLSLKTFKPVPQLNSKFAQLKFDKLLIQSIKSAKSFPALKFKHAAEEDRLQREEDRLQREEDRLQREEDRLQREKDRLQREKASNLLKEYELTNNEHNRLEFINNLTTSILNTIVNNGNQLAYEIFKQSNNYDVENTVNLIDALLKKNIDTSIKNKRGNTFTHLLLKRLMSLPKITLIGLKDSNSSLDEKDSNSINIIFMVYGIQYHLTINNLEKMLQIKNHNKQTPLHYIVHKFHCLGLPQIVKRFIKAINEKELYKFDTNDEIDTNKVIKKINNLKTIKRVIRFSRFPFYTHINRFSMFMIDEDNTIIKTFIQIPCDTPSNSIKVQIYPKELTTIDNSLKKPLKKIDDLTNNFNSLTPVTNKAELLGNLLLKIKNYVKKYYWKKCFPRICAFSLSVKKYKIPKPIINKIYSYAIDILLSCFDHIIDQIKKNSNITDDDFNRLQEAAKDFYFLSTHNKKYSLYYYQELSRRKLNK